MESNRITLKINKRKKEIPFEGKTTMRLLVIWTNKILTKCFGTGINNVFVEERANVSISIRGTFEIFENQLVTRVRRIESKGDC